MRRRVLFAQRLILYYYNNTYITTIFIYYVYYNITLYCYIIRLYVAGRIIFTLAKL